MAEFFTTIRGRMLRLAVTALVSLPSVARSERPAPLGPSSTQLKSLSLEQLGEVEITTVSKQPEEVWQTPAAVFVVTHDDISRSGATSIPELLRLVPGVEVARSQSGAWAVGIRGFNSGFSKDLLVLIDGRSVYTPLFEGVYSTTSTASKSSAGPAAPSGDRTQSTASSTSSPGRLPTPRERWPT
jgi:iron complex outermembrane recepter protein